MINTRGQWVDDGIDLLRLQIKPAATKKIERAIWVGLLLAGIFIIGSKIF